MPDEEQSRSPTVKEMLAVDVRTIPVKKPDFPQYLTVDMFDHRWPRAAHSLTEKMCETSGAVFQKYGIMTVADRVDFMAQISEETGAGTALEENLNYSAERLHEVWPSRFPHPWSGAALAHNPKALADVVYGGRYGNRPGTDDGYKFRGRGLIQVTFYDWYEKLSDATKLDLLAHPEFVAMPEYALECAAAFWKMDGISAFANIGNFRGETIRLNGGLTNYGLRLQWRALWQREIK